MTRISSGPSVLQLLCKKTHKNSKNGQKSCIFLQKCDNIYQTKTLIHCKICHCYILGLLLTVCYGNKLLLSLSEAFFPQQISDFKMASFLNLFGFSGSVEVVYSPKSRCCNVDSSYLDLGVLFLVGTTTRVDILPHKCFLQSSMAKTPETVANSFAPRVDSSRLLRSSQNVAGAILPS